MKKRIAAFFMALVITVLIPPATASAEGFSYTFEEGPYCTNILMVNVDSGTVVYSMNADEQVSMASLTKIMTYIIAYENIPDINNAVITVPQKVADDLAGTGSSLADVVVGEELTGEQLLNLMMVPSGNDAALTLATYVDELRITVGQLKAKAPQTTQSISPEAGSQPEGSTLTSEVPQPETGSQPVQDNQSAADNTTEDDSQVLSFVDLMNQKAKELGCENTNFVNPHGLYDPAHYTTARDMIKIVEYAQALPDFTEITSQLVYQLPPTNKRADPNPVYTTNRLLTSSSDLYYQYATGVKTGSLNESGYCIVASAVQNGYNYIVVAMGSPYRDSQGNDTNFHGEMYDAKALFKWAFSELSMCTISENGQLMGDINLKYAWKKDKLQLVASETINTILPANVTKSSIVAVLDVPESVEAPIKKGDVVGTATLMYADQEIGKVSVVAAESVDRSEIMKTLEQGQEIFTSQWFLIIISIIGLLLVLYIILIVISRKRGKKRRSVKRFRDM